MEVQLSRYPRVRSLGVHWNGIAVSMVASLFLIGASGAAGIYVMHASVARPLPGAVKVHAVPMPTATVGTGTEVSPVPLPDHMLLQVPFTTQAPLNNWDRHQESCEAANLTMLYYYWTNQNAVVIDPHAADNLINQIDGWKPQPDLNDTMLASASASTMFRVVSSSSFDWPLNR